MDYKNFVNIMDMANLSKEKTGLNNNFHFNKICKAPPKLRVYKDTVGSPTVSILWTNPTPNLLERGLISEEI